MILEDSNPRQDRGRQSKKVRRLLGIQEHGGRRCTTLPGKSNPDRINREGKITPCHRRSDQGCTGCTPLSDEVRWSSQTC